MPVAAEFGGIQANHDCSLWVAALAEVCGNEVYPVGWVFN